MDQQKLENCLPVAIKKPWELDTKASVYNNQIRDQEQI